MTEVIFSNRLNVSRFYGTITNVNFTMIYFIDIYKVFFVKVIDSQVFKEFLLDWTFIQF